MINDLRTQILGSQYRRQTSIRFGGICIGSNCNGVISFAASLTDSLFSPLTSTTPAQRSAGFLAW